jgi:hypothetical protein
MFLTIYRKPSTIEKAVKKWATKCTDRNSQSSEKNWRKVDAKCEELLIISNIEGHNVGNMKHLSNPFLLSKFSTFVPKYSKWLTCPNALCCIVQTTEYCMHWIGTFTFTMYLLIIVCIAYRCRDGERTLPLSDMTGRYSCAAKSLDFFLIFIAVMLIVIITSMVARLSWLVTMKLTNSTYFTNHSRKSEHQSFIKANCFSLGC